jgi:hypothetical protein
VQGIGGNEQWNRRVAWFFSLQVHLCLCICESCKCEGSNELFDVTYLSKNCSMVSLLSTPQIGHLLSIIGHDHVQFFYFEIQLQNKNHYL